MFKKLTFSRFLSSGKSKNKTTTACSSIPTMFFHALTTKKNQIFLLVLLVLHILIKPIESSIQDLKEQAIERIRPKFPKLAMFFQKQQKDFPHHEYPHTTKNLLKHFHLRNNNIWLQILFQDYQTKLFSQYTKNKQHLLIQPKYPIASHILKYILKSHIFMPTNFVEIATSARHNLGSGILIRGKKKLILSNKQTSQTTQTKKLLNLFETYKNSRFQLVFVSKHKHSKEKIFSLSTTNTLETQWISWWENNANSIEKIFLEITTINFQQGQRKTISKKRYPITSLKNMSNKTHAYRHVLGKIVRDYIITISYSMPDGSIHSIRTSTYTNQNAISGLIQFFETKQIIQIKSIQIHECKILKHHINSRAMFDPILNPIPAKVKKAFVLMEDDGFYFQPLGIDIPGLIIATWQYFHNGSRKGNASIVEQIYEMYLGKHDKTPLDKAQQIIGAMYLNFFTPSRDDILNLYIQSVPGSFWRNHNYGAKGILQSYLGHSSWKHLSAKELAWLTRIGLSPNTFGQKYARTILHTGHSKYKRQQTLQLIETRLNACLKKFQQGNAWLSPIISEREYQLDRSKHVRFKDIASINVHQSYTDKTILELHNFFGSWSLDAGLIVTTEFNEHAQKILDEELEKSILSAPHYYRYIPQYEYEINPEENKNLQYGGGSVLIKTNELSSGNITNKIVAISSKHPNRSEYFNWPVYGQRHFGSIFKWPVLLLYLNEQGTLFDTFYDVPRVFRYPHAKTPEGTIIYKEYTPENWKRNRHDRYGFYSYLPEHNITNFILSKNNTFVHLAKRIGLTKVSSFLNTASFWGEPKPKKHSSLYFPELYPVALGAHEITNLRCAQINAIIANQGILQPLSTIYSFGSVLEEYILSLESKKKQIVSREAAEAALFSGYINTYHGTARRFINGGVGKTGSSNTDVAFLGMTARTIEEDKPANHDLLRHNLLYLVNIGVNQGTMNKGSYGSTVAAINAKNVFKQILKNPKTLKMEKISGNFKKFFSTKFQFKALPKQGSLKKTIQAPIILGKTIYQEPTKTEEEITKIYDTYTQRIENKLMEQHIMKYNEMGVEPHIPYFWSRPHHSPQWEDYVDETLDHRTNISNKPIPENTMSQDVNNPSQYPELQNAFSKKKDLQKQPITSPSSIQTENIQSPQNNMEPLSNTKTEIESSSNLLPEDLEHLKHLEKKYQPIHSP